MDVEFLLNDVLLLLLALVLGSGFVVSRPTTSPLFLGGLRLAEHGVFGNGINTLMLSVLTASSSARVLVVIARVSIVLTGLFALFLELALTLLHAPLLLPLGLLVITLAIARRAAALAFHAVNAAAHDFLCLSTLHFLVLDTT